MFWTCLSRYYEEVVTMLQEIFSVGNFFIKFLMLRLFDSLIKKNYILGRCIVNENLTLGGTPLRVNSPELTRPSSLPRECNYTVSAPVGTIINASFNTFGLSEPNRLEV